MNKYIPPTYEINAFHCPHCGVYANQTWHSLAFLPIQPERRTMVEGNTSTSIKEDSRIYFKGSRCVHCRDVVIWYKSAMIFPIASVAPLPSSDMPPDVASDFNEARSVLTNSPRSSAALLRLALQKLCKHLGQPGKNINDDIGSLVQKGLSHTIQKALDIIRVVGNNAVHPGEINLDDDQPTALALFNLINLVVEEMITRPRNIDEMYSRLPKKALKGIEARDKPS